MTCGARTQLRAEMLQARGLDPAVEGRPVGQLRSVYRRGKELCQRRAYALLPGSLLREIDVVVDHGPYPGQHVQAS